LPMTYMNLREKRALMLAQLEAHYGDMKLEN